MSIYTILSAFFLAPTVAAPSSSGPGITVHEGNSKAFASYTCKDSMGRPWSAGSTITNTNIHQMATCTGPNYWGLSVYPSSCYIRNQDYCWNNCAHNFSPSCKYYCQCMNGGGMGRLGAGYTEKAKLGASDDENAKLGSGHFAHDAHLDAKMQDIKKKEHYDVYNSKSNSRTCILDDKTVPAGFIQLSETGCVEGLCSGGRMLWYSCKGGCEYWGRYLSIGYTSVDRNPNGPNYGLHYRCDSSGYVQVFNGDGCRKDGVRYQDGFIQTNAQGSKMIWACRNGQVHWLGGKGTAITADYPTGEPILGTRKTLQAPTGPTLVTQPKTQATTTTTSQSSHH